MHFMTCTAIGSVRFMTLKPFLDMIAVPLSIAGSSTYTDLTQELEENSHSRIVVELKPDHDIMEIVLRLLNSEAPDIEQLWIEKAQHDDKADPRPLSTASIQNGILDFLQRNVKATDQQIIQHLASHAGSNSQSAQHTDSMVQHALGALKHSGSIISNHGANSVSWSQPGQYTVHLFGEINLLRRALQRALQKEAGIGSAELHQQASVQ